MRPRLLPILFLLVFAVPVSRAAEAASRDELTMANGEIAYGHYVGRDGEHVVFDSDNFGRVRVRADQVKLKLSGTAEVLSFSPAAIQTESNAKKEARDEEEYVRKSWMRRLLPGWGGSIRLSEEFRSDGNLKNNFMTEIHLRRETNNNTLRLNGSYEHTVENDRTTVQLTKGDAYWRHHFTPRYFSVYVPTAEYNQCYEKDGVFLDYLLTRQEIGAGLVLLGTKRYQIRAGVAENFFKVWVWSKGTGGTGHAWVESAFMETDIKLPFAMRFIQRGTWYFSFNEEGSGWENDLELTKRLTETFNISLRQEVRKDVPGVQSSNYNLWRIVFGIDF